MASRSLQGQQGPLDLVGCCLIGAGWEGDPITVQTSWFQKCRSASASKWRLIIEYQNKKFEFFNVSVEIISKAE